MTISRALVVDDSKSARFSLKRLLEEHNIDVALANSGEEAIEFLARDKVDVIFMDHTMPGMDGLEAVSVIKSNPDTAMIPVMMYTTREGEVYVGQARALGAVGVLPKNVQPHQLFEMLANLGLVHDRRAKPELVPAAEAEADREFEQQVVGIHVQNLVSRILEDQHMTLRSDILRSQRSFAKQVAKEIVLEQARAEELLAIDEATDTRERSSSQWVLGLLVVGILVVGGMAWAFKQERDTAVQQLADLQTQQNASLDAQMDALQGRVGAAEDAQLSLGREAAEGLAWAFSRGTQVALGTPAFGAELADATEELLAYLKSLGFNGVVRMTSNLGEYCLNVDEQGNYVPAPNDLPALQCDYLGHPLEASTRVSDQLSIPFARLYTDYAEGEIRLELVALSLGESTLLDDYPGSASTAGEWNAVAAKNNRVLVQLIAN